jgi:hypothetical protein
VNPARRELVLAVLLCLLGSGLVLFAVTRSWADLRPPSDLTIKRVADGASGTRIASSAQALGLLGLVAVPAIAATQRRGRVLTGLLVVAAGGYVAVRVSTLLPDLGDRMRACPSSAKCVPVELDGTHPVWPVLAVLGGLLLVAGGLLVVVRSGRWAVMSAAYTVPSAQPVEEPVTDKGVWDALDRGHDPT